jgi:hypothetical protein
MLLVRTLLGGVLLMSVLLVIVLLALIMGLRSTSAPILGWGTSVLRALALAHDRYMPESKDLGVG